MLGQDFKYRGVSLSDYLFDKANGKGIILQSLTWNDLVTDDDQVPRQGYHGISSSPTLYRARVINMSGFIIANSRAERAIYRTQLTDMFKLESIPSPTNRGFYDFELLDDDGLEWVISAKVLNTPAYEQQILGEIEVTSFTVQLVADDPTIRAKDIVQVIAIEGFYGGAKLPWKLPVQLNDYGYIATLTNGGNWPAPLIITIEANGTTGANLRVENTTNGEFFGVQTPINDGDILIINTLDSTITLNGLDISGDRIVGSKWPYLQPGDNYYTVLDDLSRIGDGLKADVTFSWYNTKIQ